MTKLKLCKIAVSSIVGVGTTTIVNSIIQNNVPSDSGLNQVTVPVAGAVIGYMAASATKSYTDALIEELAGLYTKHVKN